MDNHDHPNQKKLHIAMFPWLAHGHITPFLQLSTFLSAHRGHLVSFISTPNNIQRLRLHHPNLHPLIRLVSLPMPSHHNLPNSAESTADLPFASVPYLKKAYDLLEPSLTSFLAGSGVDCVIHDFAPHWLPRITSRLGISSVFFSTFNATALAFLGPPSQLFRGRFQKPEDLMVVPEWIPYHSTAVCRLYEILNHSQCMDEEVSDFCRFGHVIDGSDFVIVRSCVEFESEPLTLLPQIFEKPVVPVGLLPPAICDDDEDEGGDEGWITLKKWLDSKGVKSVLYVALGTEAALSCELMNELALGIEKSEIPFVWVVRSSPFQGRDSILPPGFEDRNSGRGFIWRGWAPQKKILAHSSVGGFFTHCGWNSVIEALSHGRVLVLFSGGSSDQGLMARFLEEKQVGLEIPRDERNGSFRREVVAESIRRVVVDGEGETWRANAWAMKGVFGNVELQNKYLEEFAQLLEEGVHSKKKIVIAN